jgi:hypothetical protein
MTANTATERRDALLHASASGPAGNVKCLPATIELAASATGDTIDFGRIPSNARILPSSRIYFDDLATAGAPTLDVGLGAVNGNLANADDPDAIGAGFTLTTANTGSSLMSEIANVGLPAWDLVASESSDPGGELKVYGTVLDAVTHTTGTISVEVFYTVD